MHPMPLWRDRNIAPMPHSDSQTFLRDHRGETLFIEGIRSIPLRYACLAPLQMIVQLATKAEFRAGILSNRIEEKILGFSFPVVPKGKARIRTHRGRPGLCAETVRGGAERAGAVMRKGTVI